MLHLHIAFVQKPKPVRLAAAIQQPLHALNPDVCATSTALQWQAPECQYAMPVVACLTKAVCTSHTQSSVWVQLGADDAAAQALCRAACNDPTSGALGQAWRSQLLTCSEPTENCLKSHILKHGSGAALLIDADRVSGVASSRVRGSCIYFA